MEARQERLSDDKFQKLLADAELGLRDLGSAESNLDSKEIYRIASLYQELCQRYAYLSTFFPGTRLSRRAERVVSMGRRVLYGRRLNKARSRQTFLARVPQAFWELQRYVFFSFVIFSLGAVVAALMVEINPHFGWQFVNEQVVADLQSGKLWTEQIRGISSLASARIGTNNIQVAFTAFSFGIAGCVPTIMLLLSNGAMLGGMFAVLAHYDRANLLLDFVIAHGVLELSVIIVAGGTGIALGDALLNPGNLKRRQALAERAKPAVELMLFSAFCLIPAAVIEGYVSPYAQIPFAFKAILGLAIGIAYWVFLFKGAKGKLA